MSAVALAGATAGASVALLVTGARRLATAPRARPPLATGPRPARVERLASGRRLAERVRRAGLPVDADGFVGLTAAAATIASAAVLLVTRQPLLALPAAGAAVGAAAALLSSADRRHAEQVTRQLPAVARHLASAVGAGLSLRQALSRAAADAPEPAAAELRRVAAELALGTRVESALDGLAARAPSHDLRVMVAAILVQRRTGGNLTRALGQLADRLEERGRLARELRGATAQARMTAWLVAGLPAVGGAIAEIAAPGTLARALGQGPGLVLLGIATLLYAAGVAAIRRIGRVEP
jgi:tight adherence protein B